jgi:hypothetical protein
VVAFPGANVADVRLTLMPNGPNPCHPPAGVPPPNPVAPLQNALPALSPPPGVALAATGSGGGPGRFTSDGVATTDQAPGALLAGFAQQLQAAGWTQLAGQDDGPLAWSTWQVPQADYQGLLYVAQAPGQNRRAVHVEVQSATAPAQGGVVGVPAFAVGQAVSQAVAVPVAPVPTPTVQTPGGAADAAAATPTPAP